MEEWKEYFVLVSDLCGNTLSREKLKMNALAMACQVEIKVIK